MKTSLNLIKRRIPRGFLPFVFAMTLCAASARAGISIRHYVGYGIYPYGAGDVSTTVPGTGLLANNGSGRALVQLIYAGADYLINEVDLANSMGGYVAGDDVVWQSRIIEAGIDDIDEWGFASALPPAYTDLSWATAGFVYVRVFQNDTPQPGEAYYDSSLLAMDTGFVGGGTLPQNMTFGGTSTSGVALDQWMPQTTNIVRVTAPNEWDLMSVPLYIDPTNQFDHIATNAAVGSTVYFYDPALSNFYGGVKSSKGWAASQKYRIVLPGESFFLKSDINATNEITITGTVPFDPITNQVYERWSALGYPYPEEVAWTDTSLSSNLPTGTLVYFWNKPLQQYDILLKGPPAKGGWGTEGSNTIIYPGDGFFVRQPPGSAPFEWIVQP